MRKDNFRFIYICPDCGAIILKSDKYIEVSVVKIKCQKCGKIQSLDEMIVKRI